MTLALDAALFWLFALLACGSALAVVISQNVVRMAFWLVLSLGAVAALFFLLHADFLGATQLLIYVGGTVVLLVFGVMLTATGPYVQIRTSPAEGIIGAGLGGLLLLVLCYSAVGIDWDPVTDRLPGDVPAVTESSADPRAQSGATGRALGLAFLGIRTEGLAVRADAVGVRADAWQGSHLPGYLLPFEIVSVHLLVVLIGAAYLARAKRRVESDG
jgi:NADH:ubiquinone oxidoreductase subunit 6 (subunit J)